MHARSHYKALVGVFVVEVPMTAGTNYSTFRLLGILTGSVAAV